MYFPVYCCIACKIIDICPCGLWFSLSSSVMQRSLDEKLIPLVTGFSGWRVPSLLQWSSIHCSESSVRPLDWEQCSLHWKQRSLNWKLTCWLLDWVCLHSVWLDSPHLYDSCPWLTGSVSWWSHLLPEECERLDFLHSPINNTQYDERLIAFLTTLEKEAEVIKI